MPNASWTAVPWRVADFKTVETGRPAQPRTAQAAGGGYYLVTFKTWWTHAAASGYYAAKGDANGATNLHRQAGRRPDDALLGSRAGTPERHHGLLDATPADIRLGARSDHHPGEETSVSLAWVGF